MPNNVTIKSQGRYDNVLFTGRTTLDYNGTIDVQTNAFVNCTFSGAGRGLNGAYGMFVAAGRQPFAQFIGCTFTNTDKSALTQGCAFFGCTFTNTEDGVFVNSGGNVLIYRCKFENFGFKEGDHVDCVQCAGGTNITIKQSQFNMDARYTNSCVYLETTYGNIDNVNIVNNLLDGAQNLVWSILDSRNMNYPAPTNVKILSNYGFRWGSNPVYWNSTRPTIANNNWQVGRYPESGESYITTEHDNPRMTEAQLQDNYKRMINSLPEELK